MDTVSRASFELVFDGEAIEDGRIDATELAGALMAAAALVQAANRTLNGERVQARVNVVAGSKPASFPVRLEVLQGTWETIKQLTSGSDLKTAETLVKLLGFSSLSILGSAKGLVALLKWLRGRRPDSIEQQGDTARVTIGPNSLMVFADTINLMQDDRTRVAIEKLVRPLSTEGISKILVRDGETVVEEITDTDLSSFAAPPIGAIDNPVEPELTSTRIAAFEVVKLWLKEGDHRKWILSDGSNHYSVTIEDTEFLANVQRGEVRFGSGDVLKVRLRSETARERSGLRTEHFVEKVLEVIPLPETPRLPGL